MQVRSRDFKITLSQAELHLQGEFFYFQQGEVACLSDKERNHKLCMPSINRVMAETDAHGEPQLVHSPQTFIM